MRSRSQVPMVSVRHTDPEQGRRAILAFPVPPHQAAQLVGGVQVADRRTYEGWKNEICHEAALGSVESGHAQEDQRCYRWCVHVSLRKTVKRDVVLTCQMEHQFSSYRAGRSTLSLAHSTLGRKPSTKNSKLEWAPSSTSFR